MTINLLELAQNYFIGSTLRQVSRTFDEGERSVSLALRSVLPLALGGLLTRVQQPGGSSELFRLARHAYSNRLLNDLSELLGCLSVPMAGPAAPAGSLATWGNKLMRSMLGTDYLPTVAGMGQQAGVPTSTISSLLSMSTIVMLSLLGRHTTQNQLDISEFSAYLSNQRSSLLGTAAAFPACLRQGVLGGVAAEASAPASVLAQPAPLGPVSGGPLQRPTPLALRNIGPAGRGGASALESPNLSSWPWLLAIALLLTVLLVSMATCNKPLEPRRPIYLTSPSHDGLDYSGPSH